MILYIPWLFVLCIERIVLSWSTNLFAVCISRTFSWEQSALNPRLCLITFWFIGGSFKDQIWGSDPDYYFVSCNKSDSIDPNNRLFLQFTLTLSQIVTGKTFFNLCTRSFNAQRSFLHSQK